MLDPSLRAFVEAEDEPEAERRLASLLDQTAMPLIRTIATRKLRAYGLAGRELCVADVDDITGDTLLALLPRLQALRAKPDFDPIESFEDYTAAVTFNAFAIYLRRRHPGRSRLKNRLRYALGRHRLFAVWAAPGGMVCGPSAARGEPVSAEAATRLDAVLSGSAPSIGWPAAGRGVRRDRAVALADAILHQIGGPVDFDRLVGAIAAACPELSEWQVTAGAANQPGSTVEVSLDQRRFTERAWHEILALPARQRVALLLNLRDQRAEGMLWVLPLTGVASIRAIARALEIPDLEMAELWNRLPLDDLAIAERLSCTRQQVINLRSAARKRLTHRLGGGSQASATNMTLISPSLKTEA